MSEDGGRVAFLGIRNAIYRDGELYLDYGSRQVSFPLSLSGDGNVLAWKVQAGAGSQIVVDRQPGAIHAEAGLPDLSFNGRIVAYRASDRADSWWIVVNGKKFSDEFEDVTQPMISRDGGVVAYAAQGDKPVLFLNSKKTELPTMPRSLFLSRDGSRWGYVTKTQVVTAESPSELFDEIRDPEFSPDGKRVAFAARRGDRWLVIVDRRTIPAEGIVWGPVWSEDGSRVAYGALLGRELWWKVVDLH